MLHLIFLCFRLVCGDVQGNLDLVYGRVEKLLKKGTVFDVRKF